MGEGTYMKEEGELEAVSDLFVMWGKCGHGMHKTCHDRFDPNSRDPDGGCLSCPECGELWRGDFIEKISEFEVRAPTTPHPPSSPLQPPSTWLTSASASWQVEIDDLAAVDRAALAEYLQQHPDAGCDAARFGSCDCPDCMPKEELADRLRRAAEGVTEDSCRCVSRDIGCAVCMERCEGWTQRDPDGYDEAELAKWWQDEDERYRQLCAREQEAIAALNLGLATKNRKYQAALAWRRPTSLLKRKPEDERPPSTDPLHYLPRGWNSSLGRWQSEVDDEREELRDDQRRWSLEADLLQSRRQQRLEAARTDPYYRYKSENKR